MLISMTGYGRGEARNGCLAVALEIKTVNHRHFEALVKLPGGLWELESLIKKKTREVIQRGRAEVYVHLLSPVEGTREPVVDTDLAAKYVKALSVTGNRLGLKGNMDLSMIARLPEVVRVEERPIQTTMVGPLIEKAMQQALKRLGAMRQSEGRCLAVDIRQRLNTIRQTIQKIRQRFQHSIEQQEKRLRKKIALWLNTDNLEAKRIAQDAVFKHIRSDVTEEIVRLSSHLSQFAVFMRDRGPVGRRMDFLIQEMNREINTIGAKAADAMAAQYVVIAKEEIEKIREQVQNLE